MYLSRGACLASACRVSVCLSLPVYRFQAQLSCVRACGARASVCLCACARAHVCMYVDVSVNVCRCVYLVFVCVCVNVGQLCGCGVLACDLSL